MSFRSISLAALVVAACGGHTSAPAAPPTAAAAPASFMESFMAQGTSGPKLAQVPRVQVLDRGEGPGRVLRYAPQAGVLEVLFRSRVVGATSTGSVDTTSEVVAILDVAPSTPLDPRIMRLAATVRSVEVRAAGELNIGIEDYTTLVGRKLTIVTTTHGQLIGARSDDDGADEALLGSFGTSIGLALTAPLPETAVGRGARWSIRQPAPLLGVSGIEEVVFELGSDDRVAITSRIRRAPLSADQVEMSPDDMTPLWNRVDATRGKTIDELERNSSPLEQGEQRIDATSLGGPGQHRWATTITGKGGFGPAGATAPDNQPYTIKSEIEVTARAR